MLPQASSAGSGTAAGGSGREGPASGRIQHSQPGDGRDGRDGQAVTSGPVNSGAGETRVDLGQTVSRRGRRHDRLTGGGREEDLRAFLCLLPQDWLSTVVGSPPPSENGLLRLPHASLPERRTSFAAKFGRWGRFHSGLGVGAICHC